MGKLKFNKRMLITPIPNERDKLVRQNAKLRLQNEFLRGLLDCHGIKIPEAMDDYLEAKEMNTEGAYVISKLETLEAGISMCNQIIVDIRMNMK